MQIDSDKKINFELLPIDSIEVNPWNPNTMKDFVFNEIIKDVDEVGFIQPILVVPLENGKFRIVDGEHRYNCAKLSDMATVPAIVVEGHLADDIDLQKIQTVRMNKLRGELDKRKFKDLVNDLLQRRDLESVSELLVYEDLDHLRDLIDESRKSLPRELRKDFDKAKSEIKTVDDLTTVLNRLYNTYGSSLDAHYMVLDFGGKEHVWVRLFSRKDYTTVIDVAQKAKNAGVTFSSVLTKLLATVDDDFLRSEDLTPLDVAETHSGDVSLDELFKEDSEDG